jgi:hypothetical protein
MLQLRLQAQSLAKALEAEFKGIVFQVEEEADFPGWYSIWAIADPGHKPDLRIALPADWKVSEWTMPDQRANLAVITRVKE